MTWMTNGSVGASGAFATGDGTDTVTDGTDRALTLALIEDGMQDAWTDGGNPSMMLASATTALTSLTCQHLETSFLTM